MKSKKILIFLVISLGLMLLTCGYFMFTRGRPAPVPVKEEIMDGVTYRRIVSYFPHSMIAHVMVIDKKKAENCNSWSRRQMILMVARLKARTTSQFLEEFGVQIAINGDGFFPWWSRSPVDYYPHVGDPVTPNGFSASYGDRYADGLQNISPEPTLYISRRNEITLITPPIKFSMHFQVTEC